MIIERKQWWSELLVLLICTWSWQVKTYAVRSLSFFWFYLIEVRRKSWMNLSSTARFCMRYVRVHTRGDVCALQINGNNICLRRCRRWSGRCSLLRSLVRIILVPSRDFASLYREKERDEKKKSVFFSFDLQPIGVLHQSDRHRRKNTRIKKGPRTREKRENCAFLCFFWETTFDDE